MSTSVIGWAGALMNIAVGSIFMCDFLMTHSSWSYDGIRRSVAWGHIATSAAVVVASVFIKSPYGRHAADAASAAAASMPASISWAVQECPTLIAFAYFNIRTGGGAVRNNLATLLFATHYVNRTLVWPMLLGKGTPQRVWVTFSALTYCVFNGLLQNAVDADKIPAAGVRLDSPALAAIGAAVFAAGMWANITADRYLVSLKEAGRGYQIPRHALFSLISCPNFFAEAVEWLGFTICTAGCTGVQSSATLAALSFCIFTAANTFPRAVQHHQWYIEKFGDEYKKLRRAAVVPFVL